MSNCIYACMITTKSGKPCTRIAKHMFKGKHLKFNVYMCGQHKKQWQNEFINKRKARK